MKKIILALSLLALVSSCGSSNPTEAKFDSWNQDASALTSLKEYMKKITKEGSSDFIPKEDRIAVFDMDGTLYGELYPTYLEYVMYEYRVLDDPTYKDKASEEQIAFAQEIRAGVKNNSYPSGTDMRHARLAAEAYAGMSLKGFEEYVVTFLGKEIPTFNNMTYGEAFYEPMREVVNYLNDNDFQVYVVSGSDRFICRPLLKNGLGIPSNRVIGMDVRVEATHQGETSGVSYQLQKDDEILRTSELLIKNLKFNKVAQITQEIGKQPVLSFGNSGGDQSMHNYTIWNNPYPAEAYMLVADDTVRDYSYLTDAKISDLKTDWTNKGYHVVSMKDDFKTIYKENVTKKVA